MRMYQESVDFVVLSLLYRHVDMRRFCICDAAVPPGVLRDRVRRR